MPERAIVFLAVAQTLIWASSSYIFAALLLHWEADFGWSRKQLTGAYTLALLVSAASSPLVGRLIDRGWGPLVMGVCTAMAGGFVGCLAMVNQLWQFYALWIAIGIVNSGCLYEPCFALITRARGLEGRKAIVTITLVAGFASTISFPLANAIADGPGWREAVQVFCGISVLVAAPLMYLGAKSVEQGRRVVADTGKSRTPGAARSFLVQPQFWFLGLGFAFGAMLQQITITHFLPIMEDRNVAGDVAIVAAALIGPMQVAGRLAMVLAGERASNHLVAVFSFVAMGLSVVFLVYAGYDWKMVAAFAVFFGAAHGVVSIVRPGLAWEILGGENYGAKAGALAAFFFLGGAIAPFSGALIWEAGGYDAVLLFLFGLALAGLALYLSAQRHAKRSIGPDQAS